MITEKVILDVVEVEEEDADGEELQRFIVMCLNMTLLGVLGRLWNRRNTISLL